MGTVLDLVGSGWRRRGGGWGIISRGWRDGSYMVYKVWNERGFYRKGVGLESMGMGWEGRGLMIGRGFC